MLGSVHASSIASSRTYANACFETRRARAILSRLPCAGAMRSPASGRTQPVPMRQVYPAVLRSGRIPRQFSTPGTTRNRWRHHWQSSAPRRHAVPDAWKIRHPPAPWSRKAAARRARQRRCSPVDSKWTGPWQSALPALARLLTASRRRRGSRMMPTIEVAILGALLGLAPIGAAQAHGFGSTAPDAEVATDPKLPDTSKYALLPQSLSKDARAPARAVLDEMKVWGAGVTLAICFAEPATVTMRKRIADAAKEWEKWAS